MQDGKSFAFVAFGRMKEAVDRVGGFAGNDGAESGDVGFFDAAHAAEVFDEAGAGLRADAGDGEQFGVAVAHLAALAMVGDGEAMGLVADALDEMQHRRAAVEDDGLVFLAVEVDDLFALGDGGERLRW